MVHLSKEGNALISEIEISEKEMGWMKRHSKRVLAFLKDEAQETNHALDQGVSQLGMNVESEDELSKKIEWLVYKHKQLMSFVKDSMQSDNQVEQIQSDSKNLKDLANKAADIMEGTAYFLFCADGENVCFCGNVPMENVIPIIMHKLAINNE